MRGRRWWTNVAQVVVVVAVVAVATAQTVKCNHTVVMGLTGQKTVGEGDDDGVATKKSWGQLGDVVNEEWDDALHDNGANKVKSKASAITSEATSMAKEKCQQTKEGIYERANDAASKASSKVENLNHWSKQKAKKGYNEAMEKVSKSLHDAKEKVQGLPSETEHDNEEL